MGPYFQLPKNLAEKYILYPNTKQVLNFDGYVEEMIYFGFSIESKVPVHFKVLKTSGKEKIDVYFDKLMKFNSVNDEQLIKVHDSLMGEKDMLIITDYSNQGMIGDYYRKRSGMRGNGRPSDAEIDDFSRVTALIMR